MGQIQGEVPRGISFTWLGSERLAGTGAWFRAAVLRVDGLL